jgi:hypothetical protein
MLPGVLALVGQGVADLGLDGTHRADAAQRLFREEIFRTVRDRASDRCGANRPPENDFRPFCRRAGQQFCPERSERPGLSAGSDKPRKGTPIGTGGRGGIRTHGGVAPTAVFKTAALNHSATRPVVRRSPGMGAAAHQPWLSRRQRPSAAVMLHGLRRLPTHSDQAAHIRSATSRSHALAWFGLRHGPASPSFAAMARPGRP